MRECFIQSLLQGFRPINNEWNIIQYRFYGAKNGWRRKLEQIPGISDIRPAPGIPLRHSSGRIVVRVALSWRLGGVRAELVGTDGKPGIAFAPTVYGDKWTADQVIGKAMAKAYHMAYEQATGSKQTVEDDVEVVEDTPALPAGSGGNGSPTQCLGGSALEERRQKVRSYASQLEMEDEAVTALADRLGADVNTVEGLDRLLKELERRAGDEGGAD